MFSVFCPEHGRQVLLGFADIAALRSESDAIELEWICYCGARGIERYPIAGRQTGREVPAG